MRYLGYIMAGGVAGSWKNLGGLAATLTILAHLLELSVIRNMETAARAEKAQSTARPHLVRERGDLLSTEQGPVESIRGGPAVTVRGPRETGNGWRRPPSKLFAKRYAKAAPKPTAL